MSAPTIPAAAFGFLDQVKLNNNREWFTANKPNYQQQVGHMTAFADALLAEMNKHDVIETVSGAKSLYRIYRDVRFSKDKTPYSTYWGGRYRRAGKQRRGGYYYHFEPGDKSFVLCGFWGPSAADLKLIRDDIDFNPGPLRGILNDTQFVRCFGALQGERLKTTPKGYDSSHPAIDLLRHKQFLVMQRFTDAEVLSPGFVQLADRSFKAMRPFLNYMSDVLTVDANGEVL